MNSFNLRIVLAVIVVLLLTLLIWIGLLDNEVNELKHKTNVLQTLQHEKLNAFSNDVHNMTNVTELLEKQAKILQEIERRTR